MAVQRKLIYLASPYTAKQDVTQRSRYWKATQAAAKLAKQYGHSIYAPITMTRPMECILIPAGENLSHEEWLEFDKPFMEAATELWVLMLPDWEESTGVSYEIEHFQRAGKPIWYIEYTPDYSNITLARIIMEPV